ncbi:hypothetical protein TRIP_B200253 [uncultured Desulfatiglans sp.]|nr:hypothetical protein TRIP_B200253 [uncultured Desulfatiglans sp.]
MPTPLERQSGKKKIIWIVINYQYNPVYTSPHSL